MQEAPRTDGVRHSGLLSRAARPRFRRGEIRLLDSCRGRRCRLGLGDHSPRRLSACAWRADGVRHARPSGVYPSWRGAGGILSRADREDLRVRSLASGDIAGTGAVYTRGSRLFLGPVTAVWFSNAATAKRAEAALLNGRPLNDHGHRLQEARMCNVLIASYRRSNDRALDRKFDRAVAFMHENC